jgi:hypothetical protein
MKFLCIYKPAKPEGAPPTPDDMEQMGAYIDKSIKSGVLIATEGCLPSALGAKVRRAEGKFTVTDGPFSEAKEVVGGFALINASSKEHAIEIAREFMNVAGDGEVEMRQIYEVTDAGAPCLSSVADAVQVS